MVEELSQPSFHAHYSEQTGHHLRSQHQKVVNQLGGQMPEGVPGFTGIRPVESQRIRRSMRRISDSGRR